jgi:serine/tyrosine/threonine adenylyltransferase
MESSQLDFHSTFRALSTFKPSLLALPQDATPNSTNPKESPVSIGLHQFITNILSATPEPERLDHGAATAEWLGWLEIYATRINDEFAEWTAGANADINNQREQEMKNVNPRFVLRQWLLEEVISKVERDSDSGKRVLAKVMHVSKDRTAGMKLIIFV